MKQQHLEQILRSLDPAGGPALASAERRALDLAAIRSGPQGHPAGPARLRRRLVLVGAGVAAAGVAGGAAVLADSARGRRGDAFAATVAPLAVSGPPSGVTAVGELNAIAQRTAALPAERATGTQHLQQSSWNLATMVGPGWTRSVVVPANSEVWRKPDGTGTYHVERSVPDGGSDDERKAREEAARSGPPADGTLAPGDRMFGTPAPADPAALAEFLKLGHPVQNGPAEVIVAITDLIGEQVLGPAQRAALLRVLATVPGLAYAGEATDRAGRKGHAFRLRNRLGGLTNDLTLMVDPAGGRLLYNETVLLEAGRLNVRVPCVSSYQMYLTAEYID
jgi:hypothetical protein